MESSIISDMYLLEGNDKKTLTNTIEYVSNHTRTKIIKLSDLSLMHLLDTTQREGENYLIFAVHTAGQEKRIGINSKRFSEYTDVFIKELYQTRLMIKIKGEDNYFLISESALKSLCQKINIYTDLDSPSKYRDLWITQLLSMQNNTDVTLVFRKYTNVEKIVAVQSNQYKYIDQKILLYLVEQLQKREYELFNWKVTNQLTEIDMKNNENFGFHIITSDTGVASLVIYPVYFTEKSFVILDNSDSIKLQHRQSVGAETCEKRDKKKVDAMMQFADKDFSEFKNTIQALKEEELDIKDKDDLTKKAVELSKKSDFMKIAGKKNIINFIKQHPTESVKSKFDLIQMMWEMEFLNKEDDISTNLKFNILKKDMLKKAE